MRRCLVEPARLSGEVRCYVGARGALREGRLIAVLLAAGLLFSGGAKAIPYTLDAPVAITGAEFGNPGVVGTLHPVALGGSLSDPLGLTNGNVSFVTNDVLVVRLSLVAVSASVDALGIGAASNPFFGNPVGAGAYADVGQAPGTVTASPVLLTAFFDFSGDPLAAGESSVRLFVTYTSAGSALAAGTTANFMISSGTDFTVQGTLIPEPKSLLLLAAGVLVVALRQRSAGSRARG